MKNYLKYDFAEDFGWFCHDVIVVIIGIGLYRYFFT